MAGLQIGEPPVEPGPLSYPTGCANIRETPAVTIPTRRTNRVGGKRKRPATRFSARGGEGVGRCVTGRPKKSGALYVLSPTSPSPVPTPLQWASPFGWSSLMSQIGATVPQVSDNPRSGSKVSGKHKTLARPIAPHIFLAMSNDLRTEGTMSQNYASFASRYYQTKRMQEAAAERRAWADGSAQRGIDIYEQAIRERDERWPSVRGLSEDELYARQDWFEQRLGELRGERSPTEGK